MIAFLFPGQGSQRAGMYELLGDKANETDELFDIAKEATGRDILSLCKDATDEELKQTYNTQLSVTAMNLAFATLLKHRGVTPDVVAGHSLGQLSALHEAGVLSTYDLFRLVNKRAELMSGLKESGKLATILGLEKNVVEAVCEETCQTTDQVRIALENSYKQYVIGGREADVDVAVAKMKEAGALKIVEIRVSNAFHTYMMEPMVEPFKEFINTLDFQEPKTKILLNSKGGYGTSASEIKEDVIRQCVNVVKWEDCMRQMLTLENLTIAEVGVGKMMSSMIRGIDRSQKVYLTSNTNDFNDLAKGV